MQKTENYQLNQWNKTDRIQMEDFNADNAKIDAALAGMADTQNALQAAMANCGNCKIWTTTYTGNGGNGSGSPNTLTFPNAPLLVSICGGSSNSWGAYAKKMGLILQGSHLFVPQATTAAQWPTTWSADGKNVSWYTMNSNAEEQLNTAGSIYTVVAFMLAE